MTEAAELERFARMFAIAVRGTRSASVYFSPDRRTIIVRTPRTPTSKAVMVPYTATFVGRYLSPFNVERFREDLQVVLERRARSAQDARAADLATLAKA